MPDQLTDILNSADAAEALAKVAAVAVHVRTKQAIPAWAKSVGDTVSDYAGKGVDYAKQVGESAPDWAKSLGGTVADTAKQVWDNPHGRTALVGGGLSAAAGGLASLTDPRKRKRWLSNTLGAGLAGAAGAGALSYGYQQGLGRDLGTDVVNLPETVKNIFTTEENKTGKPPIGATLDPSQRAPVGSKIQSGYNTLDTLGGTSASARSPSGASP
jgi:hypothetical protein